LGLEDEWLSKIVEEESVMTQEEDAEKERVGVFVLYTRNEPCRRLRI